MLYVFVAVGSGIGGALRFWLTCPGTFIRLKVEPRPKLRRRAWFEQWG